MIAWGDFPTWVAAIATVGTFTGGLIILGSQGKQLILLRQDAARQQFERIRAQARLISAWPTGFDAGLGTVSYSVANASDEPAWGILGIIFSDWTEHPERVFFPIEVLGPHALQPGAAPLAVTVTPSGPRPHFLPPLVVLFSDSAGVRWARNAEGRLFQLSDGQAAIPIAELAEQPEPWRLDIFEPE